MGCDIHAGVEVMVHPFKEYPGFGIWRMAGELPINRDYRLFAILAGVRNAENITPISDPRGLPEDASRVMKGWHEHWGSDAHSASYVTLDEIQDWLRANTSIESLLLTNLGKIGSELFIRGQRWYPEGGATGDIRLVFFFDN